MAQALLLRLSQRGIRTTADLLQYAQKIGDQDGVAQIQELIMNREKHNRIALQKYRRKSGGRIRTAVVAQKKNAKARKNLKLALA